MCGACPGSPAGGKEKCPCASVFAVPMTCMPADSDSSSTASPAAGLPVVPLVTVPVMFCAAAKEGMLNNSRTHKQFVILSGAAAAFAGAESKDLLFCPERKEFCTRV